MGMKLRPVTMEDRKTIKKMWDAGEKAEAIAVELGFSPSTIYCELNRGYTGKLNSSYRTEYDPELGERNYQVSISNRGPRGPRKPVTN